MSRWSRSPSALFLAAVAGAAVFGVLAFLFSLGPCVALRPTSFGVALASGMLVGITALMLLDSRPIGEDNTNEFNATPCAACGSPLIDEWRLCPHCGQMLECETRHPAEVNSTEHP